VEHDEFDQPTSEVPTVHCEPSWTEKAEQRIRTRANEAARPTEEILGYKLQPMKHISQEEIHYEKDRMLEEQLEEIECLRARLAEYGEW
jgi:hypothetical protein